ncbi:hypothetical protein D9M69_440170 [compost metagenome]
MQQARCTADSHVGVDEGGVAAGHPVVDRVHRALALAGGATGEAQHADVLVGIQLNLVVEFRGGFHQRPEAVHARAGSLFGRRGIHHDDRTTVAAQHGVIAVQQAGFEKNHLGFDQLHLPRVLFQRVAQVGHDHRAFLLEGRGKRHQAEVVVLQDQHEVIALADLQRAAQGVGDAIGQQVVLRVADATIALDVDDGLLITVTQGHQAHDPR